MQKAVISLDEKKLKTGTNARHQVVADAALGKSVKKRQWQPLLARRLKVPEGEVTHEVADGNRRLVSGRAEGVQFFDVVEIEGDLSPGDIRRLQVSVAIHCKTLSDWDLFKACEEEIITNKLTQKEVAAAWDVSEPTISVYMSASRCIAGIQELLKKGEITFAQTRVFARKSQEQQAAILAEVLKKRNGGAGGEGENGDSGKVNRLPLVLPGKRTVTVCGEAMTLAEAIKTVSEVLRAMKKAEVEGIDGSTLVRMLKDKSKVNGGQ